MLAGNYNMVCEQGTTFVRRIELQYPHPEDNTLYLPWDLTGYTARMQVRRTLDSTTPMIALTTENAGITLIDPEGAIIVTITATQTSTISYSGVYDIEIINNGIVSRVVQGDFILSREVTR